MKTDDAKIYTINESDYFVDTVENVLAFMVWLELDFQFKKKDF